MKYKVIYSKQFKKDLRRHKRSGRFDLENFHRITNLLANEVVLPPRYCNHPLEGLKGDAWECHVQPDLLLIYKKIEDVSILYLFRLGSHSELFN